jgi:O-methyltransferase involved in polyketide biosynthesis
MVRLAEQDWRDALVAADLANEDWPDRLNANLD